MIITRTPFRVSFAGGSTDLPEFYTRQKGAVVSTAIDKYMYIMVNKRFDSTIRVSYSHTEIVDRVDQIRHPLVREVLRLVGISGGVEIVSIADIPAGSGLGSSSSFTVGLLNALFAYTGQLKSAEELARMACQVEIEVVKEPIGKQDQYIAAYGGFRYFQFNADGSVFTDPIVYPKEKQRMLAENLIMFHTGGGRQAGEILSEVKKNINQEAKMECLVKLRDLALELKDRFNAGCDPDVLSDFLAEGWKLKKQLSGKISSGQIDKYFDDAIKAGARSGKVLGAGAQGFMLFYCPSKDQPKLISAMPKLIHTSFSFEPEGSKIIFVS